MDLVISNVETVQNLSDIPPFLQVSASTIVLNVPTTHSSFKNSKLTYILLIQPMPFRVLRVADSLFPDLLVRFLSF